MASYIEVTQEDINNAVSNCSNRCAVAEAVKRAYPEAVRIRVDLQTIRWSNKERAERYIFLTPAKAQEYIIGFDAGDKIKPFRFRLDSECKQTIPSNPMPAEVQVRLHKRKERGGCETKVQKVGGKAPPLLGPTTGRGYGICGLRINEGRPTIERDVDAVSS